MSIAPATSDSRCRRNPRGRACSSGRRRYAGRRGPRPPTRTQRPEEHEPREPRRARTERGRRRPDARLRRRVPALRRGLEVGRPSLERAREGGGLPGARPGRARPARAQRRSGGRCRLVGGRAWGHVAWPPGHRPQPRRRRRMAEGGGARPAYASLPMVGRRHLPGRGPQPTPPVSNRRGMRAAHERRGLTPPGSGGHPPGAGRGAGTGVSTGRCRACRGRRPARRCRPPAPG